MAVREAGARSHPAGQVPTRLSETLADPLPSAHPEVTGRRGHRAQQRTQPRTDVQDQREKAELSRRREAEAKTAGS